MQDAPHATELLSAVQEFLMKEVMPAVREDDALAFKTLVSWNTLGILSRQWQEEEGQIRNELKSIGALTGTLEVPVNLEASRALLREKETEMALRIRKERIQSTAGPEWKYAKEAAMNRIAVVNPRFEL